MEIHAISTPYTSGKVYVIWEIPHDKINGFEVYRDDKLIATSFSEDGLKTFVPPTMFDSDHHTNLFKKKSTHQLMYVDENVYKFQSYKYQVVAKRVNSDNQLMEEIKSAPAYITAQ